MRQSGLSKKKDTERPGGVTLPKVSCLSQPFYLDQLEGEALVEDPVDTGSPRQLVRVNLVTGTLNALLKVYGKLLDHPGGTWGRAQGRGVCVMD